MDVKKGLQLSVASWTTFSAQVACCLTCVLLFVFHRNILDSDNYSPIPVASEELYQKMVGQFPFHDAELEKVRRQEEVGGA